MEVRAEVRMPRRSRGRCGWSGWDTPLTPRFGPYAGQALYHVTVHGDVDGEGLTFTFCSADKEGGTSPLEQKVAFTTNARLGSAVSPFLLTAPLPTLTTRRQAA